MQLSFDPAKHVYTLDGEKVPSVTAITGVLPKPALPWWGMGIGVEGVCKLHDDGVDLPWSDPPAIVKLLTANRLTVNHVRDQAAGRGTNLHRALQEWALEQTVPEPSDYTDDERPYLPAVAKWLMQTRPKFLLNEVRVASVEHRYAGTFDYLRACDKQICDCDGAGAILGDLKSSKGIYDAHHFQTALYMHAWAEMDGDPAICSGEIVRVGADGEYEVAACIASVDDALALRAFYDALQRVKPPRKPRTKAAA